MTAQDHGGDAAEAVAGPPRSGAEITAWRERRGLSIAELGAELELTPQGLNKMIREDRPLARHYRLAFVALDSILRRKAIGKAPRASNAAMRKARADRRAAPAPPSEPLTEAETAEVRELLRRLRGAG